MFDSHAISTVFAQTDRELWILTASDGERRGGLLASSVASASIVPHLPRIVVNISKQHFTWELLQKNPAFVLHLLRDDQFDLAWKFGTTSGRSADKLAGLDMESLASLSGVRLTEVAGWLACRVETSLELGGRTLYVAEVVEGAWVGPGSPLTMQRMICTATPDQLRQLRSQMADDAAYDAKAIEAFRASQGQSAACPKEVGGQE